MLLLRLLLLLLLLPLLLLPLLLLLLLLVWLIRARSFLFPYLFLEARCCCTISGLLSVRLLLWIANLTGSHPCYRQRTATFVVACIDLQLLTVNYKNFMPS